MLKSFRHLPAEDFHLVTVSLALTFDTMERELDFFRFKVVGFKNCNCLTSGHLQRLTQFNFHCGSAGNYCNDLWEYREQHVFVEDYYYRPLQLLFHYNLN